MKKIILGLAAAAVIALVAVPAMAATQWNFGASLRYETFWNQADFGDVGGRDIQSGGAGLDSDGQLVWGVQPNSRIRMFMKSDSLEGYIELGYDVDNNTIRPREYWGKYKFADTAYIQIGHAHQLFNTPGLSNQVWENDLGLHGVGVSFRPPTPKIILGFGNFAFALAQPANVGYNAPTPPATFPNHDIDTFIPQLQASYQYKTDTWRVKLAGAFQTFRVKTFTATGSSSQNVNSWLVSLDGNINFGPLYLAGNASVGQNWNNAQWNTAGSLRTINQTKPFNMFGKNGTRNTTSVMAAVIVGYTLTEDLRFEAGLGYRHDRNKNFNEDSDIITGYLQAKYTVAPGFFITPEIGYVHLDDNVAGTDAGYIWYAGAQWRMDF